MMNTSCSSSLCMQCSRIITICKGKNRCYYLPDVAYDAPSYVIQISYDLFNLRFSCGTLCLRVSTVLNLLTVEEPKVA